MPSLRSRLYTRRTPPPASAGRPRACSRDDRGPPRALANRASLGRGRRRACLLIPERLQLSLRDGPVHTPMPTISVLLLEMLPAEIPASLLWRAPALSASSVRP
eukprot:4886964-Pyramimonas_sp.AAC.1